MNKNRKVRSTILLFFVFLSVSLAFAQPDNGSKTIAPPGLNTPTPTTGDTPMDATPIRPKFNDNAPESRPSLIEPKQFSMVKDYGFAKPDYGYTPKWLQKDDEMRDEYKKDRYFGDFSVWTDKVVLMCRDHMYVDGDRVRVFLNGEIIEYDVFLMSEYKRINIELKPGINRIEVIALNQGTSGPNTAEFAVFDENGREVLKNVWNLATGVKASFVIQNRK